MSRSTRTVRGAVAVATGLALVAAPVAVMATSASATSPAASPKSCKAGSLPSEVNGKSAVFAAGLPKGAWVWHDSKGFHLRVTHDAKTKMTFTGTITSSAKLSAKRIRAEKHDVLWKSNKHKSVRFTLRNHGGVDGIDFKAGCAKTVKVTVKASGAKLTTAQIFLGSDAVNPAGNPVVITRTRPTPAPVCSTGALPTDVKGRPASFKAGLPTGAWLWNDAKGWHLRVTHDAKAKLNFTGSITSSGTISAHRIRAEKNDVLWKNNKHNSVRFTLRNYGAVDGIDFKAGCAKTVTLNLKAAGTALTTAQIHLGSAAVNPTANPVAITRS